MRIFCYRYPRKVIEIRFFLVEFSEILSCHKFDVFVTKNNNILYIEKNEIATKEIKKIIFYMSAPKDGAYNTMIEYSAVFAE